MKVSNTAISLNKTLPNWYKADEIATLALPQDAKDWLFECDSLTKRLRAHCTDFRVRLDSETWQPPLSDEGKRFIDTDLDSPLIRQVYLMCDGKPWVFARSIIPETTIKSVTQELGELGTRPLGEILFTHPNMQRDAIEITLLQPSDYWHAETLKDYPTSVSKVCGRRSMYYLSGQPLLVQEFFTPWLINLS